VCLCSVVFLGCTTQEEVILYRLERYNNRGNFTADISDKRIFTSQDMIGKYWVINFFFASCEEVCPKVNHNVTKLARTFKDTDMRFVSITVDPTNDNDSVLSAYKKAIYTGDNWLLTRMPLDSLLVLTTQKIGVGHLSEPALHSTRLILVDKQGFVRGFYDGLDTKAVYQLQQHLDSLLH
jgi:protein SCO1/2